MFGSTVLEVTIGLVFVYLLYSLLATTINELIASLLKFRSKMLAKGIKRMLDDGGEPILKDLFYKTPLIKYLGRSDNKKPAYLQARNFSQGLMDTLRNSASAFDMGMKEMDYIKNGLESIKNSRTKKDKDGNEVKDASGKVILVASETVDYIYSLLMRAEGDLGKFQQSLETWFDDTMERVSGWYKRKSQLFLFIIGIVLAISFNVDSI